MCGGCGKKKKNMSDAHKCSTYLVLVLMHLLLFVDF